MSDISYISLTPKTYPLRYPKNHSLLLASDITNTFWLEILYLKNFTCLFQLFILNSYLIFYFSNWCFKMKLFKFCTLLFYLFFTYPSFSAEVFDEKVLFKKGDWEVVLLRYDDRSTACIAKNGLGNKEFQIYVNAKVEELAIFYDESDVNESLKIFQFAVDDLASWYTESPYLDSGWLIMDLTSGSDKAVIELIQEIRKGQELFHLDDNNKIISSFSLKGSAASVNELVKCIEEQGF